MVSSSASSSVYFIIVTVIVMFVTVIVTVFFVIATTIIIIPTVAVLARDSSMTSEPSNKRAKSSRDSESDIEFEHGPFLAVCRECKEEIQVVEDFQPLNVRFGFSIASFHNNCYDCPRQIAWRDQLHTKFGVNLPVRSL